MVIILIMNNIYVRMIHFIHTIIYQLCYEQLSGLVARY